MERGKEIENNNYNTKMKNEIKSKPAFGLNAHGFMKKGCKPGFQCHYILVLNLKVYDNLRNGDWCSCSSSCNLFCYKCNGNSQDTNSSGERDSGRILPKNLEFEEPLYIDLFNLMKNKIKEKNKK